jgi:hypothetical protein
MGVKRDDRSEEESSVKRDDEIEEELSVKMRVERENGSEERRWELGATMKVKRCKV